MNILTQFLCSLKEEKASPMDLRMIEKTLRDNSLSPEPILFINLSKETDLFQKNNLKLKISQNKAILSLTHQDENNLVLHFNSLKATVNCLQEFSLIYQQDKTKLASIVTFPSNSKEYDGNRQNRKYSVNNENFNKNHVSEQKFTCRFYFNQKWTGFELAKKIIGKQGKNMKNIIKTCEGLVKEKERQKDFLKLRLRGKGSSHKEGDHKEECKENLHLCLSARNREVLDFAIKQVEILLNKIYVEFRKFCEKNQIVLFGDFYVIRNYAAMKKKKVEKKSVVCENVKRFEGLVGMEELSELGLGVKLEEKLKYRLPVFKHIYYGGEEKLSFVR